MRYYKSIPMTLSNLQVSLRESNSSNNRELVITSRNGNSASHIVHLVINLDVLLQIVLLANQPFHTQLTKEAISITLSLTGTEQSMVNSTFLATYKRIRYTDRVSHRDRQRDIKIMIAIQWTCFRGKRMMFLVVLSNRGRRRNPREFIYLGKLG